MEEEKNEVQDNNELEELKKKCDEYLNGWKRAKADFVNYQKEERKRLADFAKFANEAIITNLIIVLDSFNLAINAAPDPDKGLVIIKTQLEDILKKHGLEAITAKAGDQFSPELHEAIAEAENKSSEKSNTIVEIIETGYTLNGKVMRPSKVKIYS